MFDVVNIEIGYGKRCYEKLYGKRKYQALYNELTNTKTNELVEMKQKWSQLSLKNSVLEKKVLKLEDLIKSIMVSGVQISDQLTNNTEAIERIKQERNLPKSEQQVNFMVVIKELKMIFTEGVKLEKVPESFLNHKSIYETIEIIIT